MNRVCKFGHTLTLTSSNECMHCCTRVSHVELMAFLKAKNAKLIVPKPLKIWYASQELITIQCFYKHTPWSSTWINMKFKHRWCATCSKCQLEAQVRAIFESKFNNVKCTNKALFPCSRPTWLNGLELDGYNEALKLAFEYNGQQHYHFTKGMHKTYQDYLDLVARDTLKKQLCVKLGIKLVVIPYTVAPNEFEQFIDKCLK